MKESLDRAALGKARAQMALSLDLDRARYEQEQRRSCAPSQSTSMTKLLGDKELMEIKSPADGIVYYGQCINGRWSDTPSLINRYKPHSNVPSGSIMMTIVESRPLYVTSTVDESEAAGGRKGTKDQSRVACRREQPYRRRSDVDFADSGQPRKIRNQLRHPAGRDSQLGRARVELQSAGDTFTTRRMRWSFPRKRFTTTRTTRTSITCGLFKPTMRMPSPSAAM